MKVLLRDTGNDVHGSVVTCLVLTSISLCEGVTEIQENTVYSADQVLSWL